MVKGGQRKRARPRLRRPCWPVFVVFLFLLLSAFGLAPARGQEPGVTVINVPPEFSAIDIGSANGLHRIDMLVSDYNSWQDIFRVDVEILDGARSPVARVVFQQYDSNETLEGNPRFVETLGAILIRDLSSHSYAVDPTTIAERSEVRITFVITPVTGRWLRVTATDLAGLFAVAQVEYLTGVIGGANAIHPFVVVALSVTASVVLIGMRLRREMHGL